MTNLRLEILADPYFKGIPSLDPGRKKTALFFHAKDDPPEVRREIFKLLPRFGCKVQIAIRRKAVFLEVTDQLKQKGQKLKAETIYDRMISELFKRLLHKYESHIVFAHRGKWTRAEALHSAIQKAKDNFGKRFQKSCNQPTTIQSDYPSNHAGLQMIDYYLWALMRLYEKGEDRFFETVKKDYRLIMDFDDQRNKKYGEWYSDGNPLSLEKIKGSQTD
jgi:hypothetical protein